MSPDLVFAFILGWFGAVLFRLGAELLLDALDQRRRKARRARAVETAETS